MMRMAHRIDCDAPGCKATALVPDSLAGSARVAFAKLGWKLFRWRKHRQQGAGHILTCCPAHRSWRPKIGREYPLPRIPGNAAKRAWRREFLQSQK